MSRRKQLKLFSFLLVPTTLSLITTNIINDVKNENNYFLNNNNDIVTKINSPSYSTINQSYTTNAFTFDANSGSGEHYLLDKENNKDKNLLFPFARKINNRGILDEKEIMTNTIEIDLNTWKPIGMDDEIFLKNLYFDIDGYIKSNKDNEASRIMNYNINNDNYEEVPNNYNNLYTQEISYIGDPNQPFLEEKLIFNVLELKNKNYEFQGKNGYCYISLSIRHQQSKNNENHINRLLITPKIIYAYKDKINDEGIPPITIPKQEMTFTFGSQLFNYDEISRISIDSYISDNQRFYLYESEVENPENKNSNTTLDYLAVDTAKDKNVVEIGPNENLLGNKVPTLQIDTTNFYFDGDQNHQNTNFLVEVEGIKVSNGYINIVNNNTNNQVYFYKKLEDKSKQEDLNPFNPNKYDSLKLSFEINDDEFNDKDQDYFKEVEQDLFNQTMIEGFSSIPQDEKPAGVKIKLQIKAKYENGKRIPFKYEIDKFQFIGTSCQNGSQKLNSYFQIHTSNEVIVKTKPLDFSYTKLNNHLLSLQKNEYVFESNYSSNVFDDTFFVDENNKKCETNYQQVYKTNKMRFENLLNLNEFKKAKASIDLFNDPFIQTLYTSKFDEYRQKGTMSLKYTPKNANKYFRYLNSSLRAKIKIQDFENHPEIIEIDFNQNWLNEFAKNYKNMDLLIRALNETSNKYQFFNLINLDSSKNIALILNQNSIKFSKIANSNYIQATFDLFGNHTMLQNEKLLKSNLIIRSEAIKIETFNPDKITLSIKENKVRELAQEVNNYEEFKLKNSSTINSLINITNFGAIKKIEFINEIGFANKVSIKVDLMEGYIFNNETASQIVSVANINWKGQNNQAQALKLNLNYAVLAKKLETFDSAHDFINLNSNPNLNDWVGIFEFGIVNNRETTISDLLSVKFEKIDSSLRKIKVTIKAKEWRYFDFPGSSSKDDVIEFTISNIIWKNENENNLVGLDIDIDKPYLYQLLIKYFKENNKKSLVDFVDANHKNFLVYGKNQVSIIKINPYDVLALNPPIIIGSENGIVISLEINEGYYLNKFNNFDEDWFISTYQTFISIDDIKEMHIEFTKPNPELAINDIELNANKMAKDANQYLNIEQFLKSFKDEYTISEYLYFYDNKDISKIKSLSIYKTSNTSLEIKITLFNQYYFLNESPEIKEKIIAIHNLIFKNQEQDLVAIVFNINRNAIVNKAREFNSCEDMISYYESKNSYSDFQEFIQISQENINGIEWIKMTNGSSLNSIQFTIRLKSGYYFSGKNPILAEGKIQISNLLFKRDPLPEDVLIAIDIKFKGNQFLEKAKEFESFQQLKDFFLEEYEKNWGHFFELEFSKENENNINAISKINIFQKSNNKLVIKMILNEGYYFKNQNYTIIENEIIIGNVYFKNQETPNLIDIDVKFNVKKFYQLTNSFKGKTWEEFLTLIIPEIMNFKDPYNGILWTNTRNQKIFNVLLVYVEDEQLIINLEINEGFYFDENDKSNVNLKLTYSKEQLKKHYLNGYQQIKSSQQKKNLIIILSIVIPFVIVFVAIGIGIIRMKKKRKMWN